MTAVNKLKRKLTPWATLASEAEHLAYVLRGLGDLAGARREMQRAESLREAMRAIGALSQTHQ